MAVGGRWGGLQVVRIADGKVLLKLGKLEELGRPLRVSFTPDGGQLVSAGHDHRHVKVWALPGGRLERSFRVKGYPIRDLATGAGSVAVLATSEGAEVWDLGRGQHRGTQKMPYDLPVIRVAGGGRSGVFAAGDRAGSVRVFSPKMPSVGGVIPTPGKRLSALAISPDGQLVAAGFESGRVRLSRTRSLRPVRSFDWVGKSRPVAIRIPAHGRALVVAEASGRIAQVDTTRGRLLSSRRAPTSAPDTGSVALSPDGAVLAFTGSTGEAGRAGKQVRVWQSEDAERALRLPERFTPRPRPRPKPTLSPIFPSHIVLDTPGLGITSFAPARRGQFLAVAGQPSQIRVYYLNFTPRAGESPHAKRLYRRVAASTRDQDDEAPVWVAVTPDRRWLVAHGAGFYLDRWALLSGRRLRTWVPKKPPLRGLVPMHDNRTLVTLSGRTVLGWSLRGQRRFSFAGLADAYWLGVAPDNKHLVMLQGWDRVVVYALPDGDERWSAASGPLPGYEVLAMRISPRSKALLTYHRNGFVRVRDLRTGAMLNRVRVPTPAGIQRCAIRPDGRVLACAHEEGIDLTELPSGAFLGTVPAPAGLGEKGLRARGMAYSPKGNVLAVQSSRRQLVLFSFDRPGEVQRYTGVEAKARIRLGLPIVPPKVRVKPSALPKRGPLRSKGTLRGHDSSRREPPSR